MHLRSVRRSALQTALALALAAPGVSGADWYVAAGGDDGDSCQTPAAPCATIQAAVDKAAAGDTVRVGVGTYMAATGAAVATVGKNLILDGGWDAPFAGYAGLSTVNGEGQRAGLHVPTGVTAIVRRFDIRNGHGDLGGGIRNEGSLYLERCSIRDSFAASAGGGIYTSGGSLALRDSAVVRNVTSQNGGGIYSTSIVSAVNTTIALNRARLVGGVYKSGFGGSLQLRSVTITGNRGHDVGGLAATGNVSMRNSIVAGNQAARGATDCSGTLDTADYSLIGDFAGCKLPAGTGNVTAWPAELGSPIGAPAYVPIAADSPAVDTGDPTGCDDGSGGVLATDERGAGRAGRCDMGAYEFRVHGPASRILAAAGAGQRSAPHSLFPLAVQAAVVDASGTPVPGMSVTFSSPGSDVATFPPGAAAAAATTDAFGLAAAVVQAGSAGGSYELSGQSPGVPNTASFAMANAGWFVAPDGADANACDHAGAPCASVDAVLLKPGFRPGDTVLLAVGTYRNASYFATMTLNKDVRLSGGWDGAFLAQTGLSIVHGDDIRRGLHVSAVVRAERLWITRGHWYSSSGGGIEVVGDLTLQDSVVTSSRARSGAGVHVMGFLSLIRTTVADNVSTDSGGGIDNDGSVVLRASAVVRNASRVAGGLDNRVPARLVIENSTLAGNTATSSAGGLRNWGRARLWNATIAGNTAAVRVGGLDQGDGSTTLMHTLITGNTAPASPDCRGSIVSLGHNLVRDAAGCALVGGPDDLTGIEPLLGPLVGAPPYHPLSAASPAVDAGDPAGCRGAEGGLPYDQRGILRQGPCDIGAYEHAAAGAPTSVHAVAGTPQRVLPLETYPVRFEAVVLDSSGTPVGGVTVTFQAPASGPSGSFPGGLTAVAAVTDDTGVATAPVFTANEVAGGYTVAASVAGAPAPAFFVLHNDGGWLVAPGGNDASDCANPWTACATINGALARAAAGGVIRIASGTYVGTGAEVVLISKAIVISGGWNATFTVQDGESVIDGQNARRGITVGPGGFTVALDRLVIQNGNSTIGGGGGIHNNGLLTVSRSTIRHNQKGGIENTSVLIVNHSTLFGNHNDAGGGAINSVSAGSLTVNHSTLSGNHSTSEGGGIKSGAPAAVHYSTITGNSAGFMGGGVSSSFGEPFTMRGTILAGNTAAGSINDCYAPSSDPIQSQGHNLLGWFVFCNFASVSGDRLYVPARLLPLADNGGPTLTHALSSDSPAVGLPGETCPAVDADQRGVPRPQGEGCDIGAFELEDLVFANGFEAGSLAGRSSSAVDGGDFR